MSERISRGWVHKVLAEREGSAAVQRLGCGVFSNLLIVTQGGGTWTVRLRGSTRQVRGVRSQDAFLAAVERLVPR